jgi:hypothetical protein
VVTGGVIEVDAAPPVVRVDLARCVSRPSPELHPVGLNAPERLVEDFIGDEQCVMLAGELDARLG